MKPQSTRGVALARRVFAVQCGITAAAAAIALGTKGPPAAAAAVFGGIAAAVPMAWMARKALNARVEATPQEVVGGFYRGEVGKLGLTAVLFFIGVMLFAKQFLALLLTFMAAQLAYPAVLATYRE
ncbi:MAG TPA: ATP synthase subunit I [Candidatus Binatia bacterium]|nr:ATP synthase subunit I [Candidatus Binatia bacterium]